MIEAYDNARIPKLVAAYSVSRAIRQTKSTGADKALVLWLLAS